MKYCNYCGRGNHDNAKFCGTCGKPLEDLYISPEVRQVSTSSVQKKEPSIKDKVINSISDYVGNDSPVNLNWKVLFSDVFKHHTKDDAEAIFICGTKSTTPAESEVSKEWPHPWLYSRVLLAFLLAFFLLWMCADAFGNSNVIPGMIVVGSFAMPLAVMILFMELNAWRDISLYEIIQTFLVGGCASLLATLILSPEGNLITYSDAFRVGIIEEVAKALIIYIFIRRSQASSILSGMLIGACIGAGFAAFESAGYAMQPILEFLKNSGYNDGYRQALKELGVAQANGGAPNLSIMFDDVYHSIFIRGFLAPGGHVAWAAISGAAIILAAQDKETMNIGVFLNKKFVRLFIIPVVLHGLWDSPLSAWFHNLVPFSGFIGLIIIVWIVIMILINYGLSEVNWHHHTFISFE